MNSARVDPATGVSSGNFQPRVFDPQWDQWLGDFLKATDPAEQKAIIGNLVDAYVTNVLETPIGIFPAWYEYSTVASPVGRMKTIRMRCQPLA